MNTTTNSKPLVDEPEQAKVEESDARGRQKGQSRELAEQLAGTVMEQSCINESKFKEPCDCTSAFGSHTDGGNYHQVVEFFDKNRGVFALLTNTREVFASDSAVLVRNRGHVAVRDGPRFIQEEDELIRRVTDNSRVVTVDKPEYLVPLP